MQQNISRICGSKRVSGSRLMSGNNPMRGGARGPHLTVT
jgi:hypothetical protein